MKQSSRETRFSSRFLSYSRAVTPSTPATPSLRVRAKASFSQSTSMKWARFVTTSCGRARALNTIRSSFVETFSGARRSGACPSSGSVARRSPSLHGVPRVGSPASSVLCKRSDFPSSVALRFASSRITYRRVLLSIPSTSAHRRGPGAFVRGRPFRRFCRRRRRDLPGSWTIPCCMPCSPTPAVRDV